MRIRRMSNLGNEMLCHGGRAQRKVRSKVKGTCCCNGIPAVNTVIVRV